VGQQLVCGQIARLVPFKDRLADVGSEVVEATSRVKWDGLTPSHFASGSLNDSGRKNLVAYDLSVCILCTSQARIAVTPAGQLHKLCESGLWG
jgi:hypothetical protein